jgi:hypothetical protein
VPGGAKEERRSREMSAVEHKELRQIANLKRPPFNMRTGVELFGVGLDDTGINPEQYQRQVMYGPWGDFVNSYVERWEQVAEAGVFDPRAALEFEATVRDLAPYLAEMEWRELAETPKEARGDNNSDLILHHPIRRLLETFERVGAHYEAMLQGSELEEFKRRRKATEEELGARSRTESA